MEEKRSTVTDFTLDVPAGRDVRILQLTDIQTIRLEGVRETSGGTRLRQVSGAFFSDENSHSDEIRAWRYVREAVSRAQPDLIVLTGDNIYGQTDDDGSQWTDLCAVMDSFGIPWAPVFGNHDNESAKGVLWQIEQVRGTKHGMIRRGDVTGNCNYTVGIRQDGVYRAVLFMTDSGGCKVYANPGEGMAPDNRDRALISSDIGVKADQLAWMKSVKGAVRAQCGDGIPSMIFMHIPPREAAEAIEKKYLCSPSDRRFVPDQPGDSGISYEKADGFSDGGAFWRTAKEIGCTDIFVGHQHRIALSMVFDGIRLTYGMKTGTYDYFHPEMLGGTLITLKEGGRSGVEYLPSQLAYVPVPGAWRP